MNVIDTVSEHHAWCEFLRTEYLQHRDKVFGPECDRLTKSPDFADQSENDRRKALLISIRGAIVQTIPVDTEWQQVNLSPEEFARLYVLKYLSWAVLSDGSYLLSRAANNVFRIPMLDSKVVKAFAPYAARAEREAVHVREKVMTMLKSGVETSQFRPIMIRQTESNTMTIIDGCHRATALYIERFVKAKASLKAVGGFLGTSSRMNECQWLSS